MTDGRHAFGQPACVERRDAGNRHGGQRGSKRARATVFDSALNAFRPSTLLIGGALRRDATTYSVEGTAQHVVLRNGVSLSAQEVLLSAAFGATASWWSRALRSTPCPRPILRAWRNPLHPTWFQAVCWPCPISASRRSVPKAEARPVRWRSTSGLRIELQRADPAAVGGQHQCGHRRRSEHWRHGELRHAPARVGHVGAESRQRRGHCGGSGSRRRRA